MGEGNEKVHTKCRLLGRKKQTYCDPDTCIYKRISVHERQKEIGNSLINGYLWKNRSDTGIAGQSLEENRKTPDQVWESSQDVK